MRPIRSWQKPVPFLVLAALAFVLFVASPPARATCGERVIARLDGDPETGPAVVRYVEILLHDVRAGDDAPADSITRLLAVIGDRELPIEFRVLVSRETLRAVLQRRDPDLFHVVLESLCRRDDLPAPIPGMCGE